jgi:hypothetical protein
MASLITMGDHAPAVTEHEELAALARRPLAIGGIQAVTLARNSLWEARFDLTIAAKAVVRGDATYVAGCLFRALTLGAYALTAHNEVGRTTEKGAIAVAGRCDPAPPDVARRCREVMGTLGTTADDLSQALRVAGAIVDDTEQVCARSR